MSGQLFAKAIFLHQQNPAAALRKIHLQMLFLLNANEPPQGARSWKKTLKRSCSIRNCKRSPALLNQAGAFNIFLPLHLISYLLSVITSSATKRLVARRVLCCFSALNATEGELLCVFDELIIMRECLVL